MTSFFPYKRESMECCTQSKCYPILFKHCVTDIGKKATTLKFPLNY